MNRYILNRPVNALRRGYEPALLGAKIRAKNASDFQAAIVERSIEKKLNSTEDWNYAHFSVFKGLNESGSAEYRDCLSPSPSTAAAEAYLINDLADIADIVSPSNVYSYKVSKRGASANYIYYLSQFLARNEAIADRLNEESNKVAVFFDIQKFYPSVDSKVLQKKLVEFRDTIKPIKDITTFVEFALRQLDKSPSGIPIGTEISHILANIYLGDLDSSFSSEFGQNYARYVDDITIVCARSEVDRVRQLVNSRIGALGLTPNVEKEHVYSASEWNREIATDPVMGEDFYDYCLLLEGWLKQDLSRLTPIRNTLHSEGFNIPFEKIVARTGWRTSPSPDGLDIGDIVLKTKQIRKKYTEAAMRIGDVAQAEHTRGHLQQARRALNPLFYLLPPDDYAVISDVAATNPKLCAQHEVSKAILSADCSSLINFPGSTVSSYCEIWKTLGASAKYPQLGEDYEYDDHQRQSLIALALHGVLAMPSQLESDPLAKALRPEVEMRSGLLRGFEGEIEALRINLTNSDQANLLGRRENEEEQIDMQALELGDQMISS